MKPISRRAVIAAGFAGVVALGVGLPIVLGSTGATSTGNLLFSRRKLPRAFQQPLTVPEVLQPFRTDVNGDHYRIVQRGARASILPGVSTPIWSYNGTFPGPTIESRRGKPAVVTHINDLPLPTVVHLHGGRTPHDSDGYPIDYVFPTSMSYYNRKLGQAMDMGPGHAMRDMTRVVGSATHGSRTYTYPLDQRAATLWYHDHRMDFTGPSVWRGLAGFHIVRDDEEDSLKLPSGNRELPLMIVDRSFDADGSFLYPSVDGTLVNTPGVAGGYVAGVLGDTMLVNGSPWPITRVDRAHYRLRFLNASNARRLSVRLDPPPPEGFVQIGTDGGLLSEPVPLDHIVMAPAQRFDVVVNFSHYEPGTEVTLYNDFDTGPMGRIMQFIVGDRDDDTFTMPEKLSTITALSAGDAVTTRSFQFHSGKVGGEDGWLVGNQPFTPGHIAATVRLGTIEVWELYADFHHPVHIHLNPFQVLSRGSDGPGPFDHGWKDTIDLSPGEQARIAIRFEGYRGKYVFHCHNLEHEDMAMMANFETI